MLFFDHIDFFLGSCYQPKVHTCKHHDQRVDLAEDPVTSQNYCKLLGIGQALLVGSRFHDAPQDDW
jgi:hypothetical protein